MRNIYIIFSFLQTILILLKTFDAINLAWIQVFIPAMIFTILVIGIFIWRAVCLSIYFIMLDKFSNDY